jgi:hypothetical protein
LNVGHRPWWVVVLLLVALAGAGAVAWHFLRVDSSFVRSDRHARSDATTTTQPRPDESTTSAAAQREAEAPLPNDAAAAPALAPGASVRFGIALTVVRHEDGVPIAGAQLVVLDARKVEREEIAGLVRDPSELRRRASFFLRTDKDGFTQVPRPVSAFFVVGLGEKRRGVRSVTATTFGPQRLELFPPREVAVRVVDGAGARQSGVEVALAEADRLLRDATVRATTDEQGEAKLADVELEEAMQSSPQKLVVGFTFPLLPIVSAELSLDPPPSEPVVLTLPATGALAFHVVDENGDALAAAGTLQLVAATSADAISEANRMRGADRQSFRLALDEQGRAAVPRVGLGLAFRAIPSLPERVSALQHFSGPTRAGETIDVALPAGAIGPLFTGRVSEGDDAPLAGADLRGQFDAFDASGKAIGSDAATAKIDADGAFRLDFSRSGSKGQEGRLFLRATRDGGSPAEGTATATLPATGILELGTIRLAPPPLIASGIVVDDEALAVEGALVTIDAKVDPPIPFKVNHLPSATTSADGLFELRGEIPDGALSLRAQRGGYLPMKPLRFAAGASDLTLTLRMGGSLAGSIVVPDGFPAELLFARLQLPGSWPLQADTQPIRENGRFRMSLLPAGLWDFELLLGRDPDNAELLTAIHQVAIHPFELTRDPRLQELDLLTLARVVEATVRVPGGELAETGSVGRAASLRNGRGQLSVPLKGGRALMPCTSVPVELSVVVPGYLVQTARGVEGPIDVMMRRGLAVHFVVTGRNERQPEWIPVRVTSQPRDEALAAVWPGDPVPLTSGEAKFTLPAPGRYRARIDFAPPPDPSRAPEDAAAARAQARAQRRSRIRSEVDFEVKDVDDEQRIELKVKR